MTLFELVPHSVALMHALGDHLVLSGHRVTDASKLQDRTVTLEEFVSMQEHNVRVITDQLVERNREVSEAIR